MRLIDADALGDITITIGGEVLVRYGDIMNEPTIEAIPVRHAHMLSDEDGNIQCSECGSGECWGNYCMNCGAKMENNNV